MFTQEERDKEETLPFVMKHLPDYFKEKAKRELNETPERRITGLEEMKKMARDDKHTCDIHFDDDHLLQFLRHRKYDVSRAFKQLVNFTCFIRNHNSMFLSFKNGALFGDPRRHIISVLPRRCPDGCTMILVELGKWDSQKISFDELWQLGVMLVTQSLRNPMTQINGVKLIYDFTNTSLKHARYCTPSTLYLFYHAGVECFPLRPKGIYLVSESLIMKAVYSFAKPLVSQKLKQRVFVNSSRRDLLNHFPASVLPVKYGGVVDDYYSVKWTKEANKQQEVFGLQGQCNYY